MDKAETKAKENSERVDNLSRRPMPKSLTELEEDLDASKKEFRLNPTIQPTAYDRTIVEIAYLLEELRKVKDTYEGGGNVRINEHKDLFKPLQSKGMTRTRIWPYMEQLGLDKILTRTMHKGNRSIGYFCYKKELDAFFESYDETAQFYNGNVYKVIMKIIDRNKK